MKIVDVKPTLENKYIETTCNQLKVIARSKREHHNVKKLVLESKKNNIDIYKSVEYGSFGSGYTETNIRIFYYIMVEKIEGRVNNAIIVPGWQADKYLKMTTKELIINIAGEKLAELNSFLKQNKVDGQLELREVR